MKRLLVALAVFSVGCSTEVDTSNTACLEARQAYQDHLATYLVGDTHKLQPWAKALPKAEWDALYAEADSLLDASNKACGTGPYG